MGNQEINLEEIKKEVIRIAKKAGDEIMLFYKKEGLEISDKEDNSPVTEADIASNKIILEDLSKFGWPILSEETADDMSRFYSDLVWIVDPIDGTVDFIKQTDEFCIMIGLAEKGKSILGVVYLPALNTFYVGGRGLDSEKIIGGEVKKLKVSEICDKDSIRIVASRAHYNEDCEVISKEMGITNKSKMGSNGLKVSAVAEGVVDIYFSSASKMGEWDMCAPQAIIESAGGKITGIFGEDFKYNKENPFMPNGILVTNGLIHDQAIESIKKIGVQPH